MEQIATALSEASLRKGETERLKEDLAVNEKATQGRKGDIEQVAVGRVQGQSGAVGRVSLKIHKNTPYCCGYLSPRRFRTVRGAWGKFAVCVRGRCLWLPRHIRYASM